MSFKYVYIFPLLVGIATPITIITTFLTSVLSYKVNMIVPYISDTGAWPPESCYFGLTLNTGVIFLAIIVCVRYLLVETVCSEKGCKNWIQKWNFISLGLGCVAGVGLLIIANFQDVVDLTIHLIGASLLFGFCFYYCAIQLLISFALKEFIGNKYINVLRLACVIIIGILLPIGSVTGLISYIQFDGDDITKWGVSNKGYILHVISAICEWLFVFPTILYFTSYAYEFRYITIEKPKLHYSVSV